MVSSRAPARKTSGLPAAAKPTETEPHLIFDGDRLIMRIDLPHAHRLPVLEVHDGHLDINCPGEAPLHMWLPEGVYAEDLEATMHRGALELSLPIGKPAEAVPSLPQ